MTANGRTMRPTVFLGLAHAAPPTRRLGVCETPLCDFPVESFYFSPKVHYNGNSKKNGGNENAFN